MASDKDEELTELLGPSVLKEVYAILKKKYRILRNLGRVKYGYKVYYPKDRICIWKRTIKDG